MSRINSLLSTVDIICPHCDKYNEIEDVEVSVAVWGTDISRHKDEGVNKIKCQVCDQRFTIAAQLDIDVRKS